VHDQNAIFNGTAITGVSAEGVRDALRRLAPNGRSSVQVGTLAGSAETASCPIGLARNGRYIFALGNCLGRGMSAALVELFAPSQKPLIFSSLKVPRRRTTETLRKASPAQDWRVMVRFCLRKSRRLRAQADDWNVEVGAWMSLSHFDDPGLFAPIL
jgi:hypothetical protein